jgi:hypothetical protein
MRRIFALSAFVLLSAVPLSAHADAVPDWNKNTVDEIRKLGLGPNPATRALAIAQIAAYEAVNAVTKNHEPYHAALTPLLPVSRPAAVASAVYWALVLQFPNEKPTLDTLLDRASRERVGRVCAESAACGRGPVLASSSRAALSNGARRRRSAR